MGVIELDGAVPCRFCGLSPVGKMRPAKHDKHGRMWLTSWRAECGGMNHHFTIGPYATKAEATEAWNRAMADNPGTHT